MSTLVLDANDILQLVAAQWNPSNVPLIGQGQYVTVGADGTTSTTQEVINGGFENGSTGWTLNVASFLSTDYHHSGTHSLEFQQSGTALQTFSTSIPVSSISSFVFYLYAFDVYTGGGLNVNYSDSTFTSINLNLTQSTWVENIINLSSLSSGKSIVSIEFYAASESGRFYLDDVSLIIKQPASCLLSLDEFNPMHPDFQIVFINGPERIIYVSDDVVKHEQDIIIQMYTKLIHYQPDDIVGANGSLQNYRQQLLDMKHEMTRIFNVNRFDSLSETVFTTINHSNWKDAKFPHGFGNDPEPISFDTTMRVQIHWYENLSGSTDIGSRVSYIQIMGEDLLGANEIDWEDMNPWVQIQVPKGPVLEQHLLGPHTEIKFTCHDYHSLYTVLYTIPISTNLFPVNVDNSKTVFSTNPESPQFIVALEDSAQNIDVYNLFNVRIKTVKLVKATVSGTTMTNWEVSLMADYVYAVPSTGV